MRVRPSGLLPSWRTRPAGSLTAGTLLLTNWSFVSDDKMSVMCFYYSACSACSWYGVRLSVCLSVTGLGVLTVVRSTSTFLRQSWLLPWPWFICWSTSSAYHKKLAFVSRCGYNRAVIPSHCYYTLCTPSCLWGTLLIKPSFHYPSWRPKLTAQVDGWPVSITRQHGQCWRAVLTGTRFH